MVIGHEFYKNKIIEIIFNNSIYEKKLKILVRLSYLIIHPYLRGKLKKHTSFNFWIRDGQIRFENYLNVSYNLFSGLFQPKIFVNQ